MDINSSLLIPNLSLVFGWLLDRLLGDPERLPHPVVLFGKMIAGENVVCSRVHCLPYRSSLL